MMSELSENNRDNIFSSMSPEIDYDDLRNKIKSRLSEMFNGWIEKNKDGLKGKDGLIEISDTLWLNGHVYSEQNGKFLSLQIIDNKNMPGADYSVASYSTHCDEVQFVDGQPVTWNVTDVKKLRKEKIFNLFPGWARKSIDIDAATPEELLEMADKIKMYSEPWEYFDVVDQEKEDNSDN